MARVTVKINEIEYPCYFTLGAGVEFKQLTGHDVSKMDFGDLVDLGTLLFCQCKWSCKRENIDFPYTYEQFLCQMSDEALYEAAEKQEKNAVKKKKVNRRQ